MRGVRLRTDYEELLAYAEVLDDAGDEVRRVSTRLASLAADGDVLEAAVLCPREVASLEASIAVAAGPHGAAFLAVELEVAARWVRGSVRSMQLIDAELSRRLADLEKSRDAAEAFLDWASRTAEETKEVLIDGAQDAWDLSEQALDTAVEGLQHLAISDLQLRADLINQTLYDHPWMQEALTRALPGIIQGTAMGLTSLMPNGQQALRDLSGGNWPTGDYTSAVAGLVSVAEHFGLLEDSGEYTIAPFDGDYSEIYGENFTKVLDRTEKPMRSIVQGMNRAYMTEGVHIVELDNGNYVVDIPGTKDFGPKRGDTVFDLSTNTALLHAESLKLTELTKSAMEQAGIPADAEVMLTGHSQGGMAAAHLASDRELAKDFKIASIVTAGSPIARYDIPRDVSVLALEHEQDPVPKLEGMANPRRDGGPTLTTALSPSEGANDRGWRDTLVAHGVEAYADTGVSLDGDRPREVRDWARRNDQFLGPGERRAFVIDEAGK